MKGLTVGGLVTALVFSAVVFVPLGLWLYGVPTPIAAKATAVVQPPPLAMIQKKGVLVTACVHIADVIEGSNNDYKGKWSLHGEVTLGVDLGKAAYVHVDAEKKEALISLPTPHLVASKVDHERSEELKMEWVAWVPLSSPKVLRDEVWKHADRKVQKLGMEPGYIDSSRIEAEHVVAKLFGGLDWKVSVQWQDGSPPAAD